MHYLKTRDSSGVIIDGLQRFERAKHASIVEPEAGKWVKKDKARKSGRQSFSAIARFAGSLLLLCSAPGAYAQALRSSRALHANEHQTRNPKLETRNLLVAETLDGIES